MAVLAHRTMVCGLSIDRHMGKCRFVGLAHGDVSLVIEWGIVVFA